MSQLYRHRLKQRRAKNRDALGERVIIIARRLESIFAIRMARILIDVFRNEQERILERLNQRSLTLKINTREIFNEREFKEALRVAWVGIEELAIQGFDLGVESINLFGDDANILAIQRPDLQSFQGLARARTAFTIDGIASQTRQRLQAEVLGVSSPQEVSRIIQQSSNFSAARANVIARTEASYMLNRGQVVAWEASGVVEKKEWFTAQDERVCPWCMQMNEEVVELNANFRQEGDQLTATNANGTEIVLDIYEDVQGPPIHPNCRCALLPVNFA